MKRMFAPSVQFAGVAVPIEELAAKLAEHISPWLPDRRQWSTGQEKDGALWVVGFRMTAAEFLSWGCMLMETIHDACAGTTADEGNEFLCCYNGEDYTKPLPAKAMYAQLYLSDDGGATWLGKESLQLKR